MPGDTPAVTACLSIWLVTGNARSLPLTSTSRPPRGVCAAQQKREQLLSVLEASGTTAIAKSNTGYNSAAKCCTACDQSCMARQTQAKTHARAVHRKVRLFLEALQAISEQLTAGLQQGSAGSAVSHVPLKSSLGLIGKSQGAHELEAQVPLTQHSTSAWQWNKLAASR